MKSLAIVLVIIFLLGLFGEVWCIYKAVSCNWEPIGKAEILYTGAALTGLGCVIGYFNIDDK
ncbi:MAG: hypothetical protein ACOH2V_00505 [Candidatus Saccharimonadaceae bacterium]